MSRNREVLTQRDGTSEIMVPTGTVAFLFSGVEGSTERWERSRDAMAAAVARHDALMRAALEARGAYVFKTMGDAFCAAFARPEEAVAAALEAQRALAGEDFSAVDGMHVLHGAPHGERERTRRRLFRSCSQSRRPALGNRARRAGARLRHRCRLAPRSDAAAEQPARSRRAPLKDLARPEQVYQLVAPDLPQSFPALRSLDQLPNNLPPQLTSFVGREAEVAEIKALLEGQSGTDRLRP